MNDTFGKIVSIWIGCILLFLLPISYFAFEQEQMERLFILTETSYFVDSVRNTGRLTDSMLEEFEQKLSFLSGIYQVEMEHGSFIYTKPQDNYRLELDCYYTKQIREQLEADGEYLFFQGDFFKVSVVEGKTGIGKKFQSLLLGTKEGSKGIAAYYGGMIRCEVE